MAELSTIPEQTKQRLESIGTVDVVIGLIDQKAGGNVAATADGIRRALAGLATSVRAVLVYNDAAASPAASLLPEGFENESLRFLTYSLPVLDPSMTLAQSISSAYRAIWAISDTIGARACVILTSATENVTPGWTHALAQPILEREFDLVAPCYVPHKFEGLLNSAILYPLTRAVYGKRIQNPLGPDFGFGARLVRSLLQLDAAKAKIGAANQFLPVGPVAVVRGFKVCQVYLGEREHPPVDWKNLDSVIANVLGPLFLDIERDAPFWQHIRSSEAIPAYGDHLPLVEEEENVAFDLRRLLEPFQLGFRNLREIWALVLPPGALLELSKAHRLPPEQFRIPDELWARIVYDFALAYRLRTIGRDHLLRAMTPLYLGWVASYALEVESLEAAAVQKRLERLCAAYENGKPYLLSRWRWPDRFNP
jgi:glucosylglycerate synthase